MPAFPKAFNYRVLTCEYMYLSQVSQQHWEKESGIKSCLTKSREKGVVNLQTLAHFLEGTNCWWWLPSTRIDSCLDKLNNLSHLVNIHWNSTMSQIVCQQKMLFSTLKQGNFVSATSYFYFISNPLVYKGHVRIISLTMLFSSYIKDFLKIGGLFSLELVCFDYCFDYQFPTWVW